MDIAERVKAIIADQLMVDIKQVTDSASFTDDLGADFFDTIELVIEFEDEFNLAIPDEDLEKLTTVLNAVAYLEQRLAEKEAK